MGFIKKRLFLIACIAAFLLGVGLFIPGMMINAENRKELVKVESQYNKVDRLAGQAVHKNELAHYKENAELAQKDAKKVDELARQTTSRALIHKKVFPEPLERQSRIIYYQEFAANYCRLIDNLMKITNGGSRPSEVDKMKVREEYRKRSGAAGERGGGLFLDGQSRRSRGTPEDKLLDDLSLSRAKEISVYINPYSFCCYDYWKDHPGTGARLEMLQDSWFTQVAAWIQEDVVLAVNQVNSIEKSVLENPVKRLIEISFS